MIRITVALLLVVCMFGGLRANSECRWAQTSYNSKEYIRVIKKPLGDIPLSFLCWKRDVVEPYSIYEAVKNCDLVSSGKKGLDCLECLDGFKLDSKNICKKFEKK